MKSRAGNKYFDRPTSSFYKNTSKNWVNFTATSLLLQIFPYFNTVKTSSFHIFKTKLVLFFYNLGFFALKH